MCRGWMDANWLMNANWFVSMERQQQWWIACVNGNDCRLARPRLIDCKANRKTGLIINYEAGSDWLIDYDGYCLPPSTAARQQSCVRMYSEIDWLWREMDWLIVKRNGLWRGPDLSDGEVDWMEIGIGLINSTRWSFVYAARGPQLYNENKYSRW